LGYRLTAALRTQIASYDATTNDTLLRADAGGAILPFPSAVRARGVADGRTLVQEARESMKRTLLSLTALLAIVAAPALPALAEERRQQQ
jgi:hypothetical protein